MLTFTAANHVPFNVRLVQIGESYGRDDCLTHGQGKYDLHEPMVEFYDARHMHTSRGQFVSRYYVSTLLNGASRTSGLMLDGGVPEWTVDAASMQRVVDYLTGATDALS